MATTQAVASSTTSNGTGEGTASTAVTTTVTTAAGSGGGTAAGVCELVTADELAGIFNVASVTTSVLEGPPDNCIVESDAGDPLTAWSLTVDQAQVVFDALTADPASIEVPGIGDGAFIVQNTGLLVLKGAAWSSSASRAAPTSPRRRQSRPQRGLESSPPVGCSQAGDPRVW